MTRLAARTALALLGAVAVAGAGCSGGSRSAAGHAPGATARQSPIHLAPPRPTRALPGMDLGANVLHPEALRSRPGGRVVARVGPRTTFGSPTTLAVVARRPGWLGVLAPQLPDGAVGWVPAAQVSLVSEPVRLRIDLARRTLTVTRVHRVLLRMTVAIGSPATPTPTGRFAVTDALREPPGTPYGCCVLALSGHQPHLREGWDGGDRLAVHGTDQPASIGEAVSGGCLRAAAEDMRRLFRVVSLGARVEIVA